MTMCVFLAMATSAMAKDYSDYAAECEPLKGIIVPILRENGVPDAYFYLMVAESHCQDKVGKAGERSQWQMMPRTAKKYGCNQFDDLECMTQAAASYIKNIERNVGKDEEAIVCSWNMGRRNYQKKGATKTCKGLHWMMKMFKRTDEVGI